MRYLHFFLFCVCLLLTLSSVVAADSVQTITLKYRDAKDMKQVLEPLLPQGSAMTIDQQRLIIRAPANIIKGLRSAVKRLDKPQSRLKVSVYRGKYPSIDGRKIATTNAAVNRLSTLETLNGQTIIVSERGVSKIAVSEIQYGNNINTIVPLSSNAIANIAIGEEGVLQANNNGVLTKGDETSGVISLPDPANNTQGETLRENKYQIVENMTGMHLRVALLGKDKVTVTAKFVSPSALPTVDDKHITTLSLSTSIETVTSSPLNQWFVIGELDQFSHQPALNNKGARRKTTVASTETSEDSQQSVWVMVEKL